MFGELSFEARIRLIETAGASASSSCSTQNWVLVRERHDLPQLRRCRSLRHDECALAYACWEDVRVIADEHRPTGEGFELLCEIEPATGPDLTRVRRQIAMLHDVADSFLVPDNHLGRATVSSIAVAREVAALGGSAVACVNSRDRNLLGFRRDLLTAAAYGVDRFLFVRGDDPVEGERSTGLTVHRMIEEAQAYEARTFVAGATIRVGTTVPSWKAKADFLLAQVSYDLDGLLAWRDGLRYDGKLFAGVMVMASSKMAQRIAADVSEIGVPADLIKALDADRDAGVERAVELVERIRESRHFDGIHLVPVGRYADIATLLRRSRHP